MERCPRPLRAPPGRPALRPRSIQGHSRLRGRLQTGGATDDAAGGTRAAAHDGATVDRSIAVIATSQHDFVTLPARPREGGVDRLAREVLRIEDKRVAPA